MSGRQTQGAYVSTNAKKLPEAETIYSEAIKDTLQKTEAIEKHVKTVTLRAESLASTEADFFKNTPRPTRGNAEALERALGPAARPAPHTPRKKGQARAPA